MKGDIEESEMHDEGENRGEIRYNSEPENKIAVLK